MRPFDIPAGLVEAARASEAGAVERLVAAAWPHAFRIAYSFVRDRGLAEDAAQEACAIVYRKVSQLRDAAAFRVWFYRLAMRQAMRLERKAQLTRIFSPEAIPDNADASVSRVDVLRALTKLPPRQRCAIVLHYYAGMSSGEIADTLGIADSSVRFHIMQGRNALERLLRGCGSGVRRLERVHVV